MSDQPPFDARAHLAAAGRAGLTRPDIAQDVLSGRLNATAVAPLLAGLIDGAIRTTFIPVTGADHYNEFDPCARPLIATVRLLDGTRVREACHFRAATVTVEFPGQASDPFRVCEPCSVEAQGLTATVLGVTQ